MSDYNSIIQSKNQNWYSELYNSTIPILKQTLRLTKKFIEASFLVLAFLFFSEQIFAFSFNVILRTYMPNLINGQIINANRLTRLIECREILTNSIE